MTYRADGGFLRRLLAAAPLTKEDGVFFLRRGFELARAELAILVTILVVTGGIWAFVSLAGEVREGETESFDRVVMLAFRSANDHSDPVGPIWFESMVRDVTALGSYFVLTFATLAVIGFLLLAGKRGAAFLVFVSVAGGTLLGTLLKLGFERPRPDLVPHGVEVQTASFPSNHAMLSAVTYLTLGALLARLEVKRAVKFYFLAVSAVLTALVGLSRVYLGVHWPTDVLAGWAVGAAWAMAVWLVALWLQRRGQVERMGAGDSSSR
jgi:undecaprenyl-diphosphatase